MRAEDVAFLVGLAALLLGHVLATAIGAVLFLASDTVLAWKRFVGPLPRGPQTVIVTYHLAQLLIVGGLICAAHEAAS